MTPIAFRITGRTRMMFILADPVAHVVGTDLLTQFFQGQGVDAVVAPLHVSPPELGTVVAAIRRMNNVVGFGVTIPHKTAIAPVLDALTERARRVGAVNFVRRSPEGRLEGDNIDGLGFLAGLAAAGIDPRGMRVLQVGAGGAGRAIAFALAEAGAAALRIANRSPGKAEALAASVQAAAPACRCEAGEAGPAGFDLVVNTTSLGMREGDALPVATEGLAPHQVVAEVVMTPAVTPLLAAAQGAGCRTVGGRAMLEGPMEAAGRIVGILG